MAQFSRIQKVTEILGSAWRGFPSTRFINFINTKLFLVVNSSF
jgi:hypothetical protein